MTEKVLDQCPKCLSKITNDVECETCGIIFEKYFQTEARKKAEAEQVTGGDQIRESSRYNTCRPGSHLDHCSRSIFDGGDRILHWTE